MKEMTLLLSKISVKKSFVYHLIHNYLSKTRFILSNHRNLKLWIFPRDFFEVDFLNLYDLHK